jgi:23S rRNA pseudouridine2605 synthase
MEERLQKILSQWGVASRRQAEQLILSGRVTLNGATATLGQKADPATDRIEVDGVQIGEDNRPDALYFLLNKPLGVVSTCHDPEGRSTVLDYVPASVRHDSGLHPVGRLDTDSTGALLLTNDGSLTFLLTHPKHSIEKTYLVWVWGCPTPEDLQRWRSGMQLEGQKTLPAGVRYLKRQGEGDASQTLLEVKLREGRNRQIRRVAEQLGYPVVRLHRVAIGSLQIGRLAKGECRPLTSSEVQDLKEQVQHLAARGKASMGKGDRPRKGHPRTAQVTDFFVSGGSALGGRDGK